MVSKKEFPIGAAMSVCSECDKTFIFEENPDWKENHIQATLALEEHFRKEHELS